MYYVLIYHNHSSYLEERRKYRAEHLRLLQALVDSGELSLAGAVDDPADLSLYIFKGPKAKAAAEEFVASDPYVANGLVEKWAVRKWNAVVGVDL
ncbi:MAG: YciI-like protein [Bacteroidota bacterium]